MTSSRLARLARPALLAPAARPFSQPPRSLLRTSPPPPFDFDEPYREHSKEDQSKWKEPGSTFDKAAFQHEFDRLRPEGDEHFDRQMKVYGLNDGHFLINHYWVAGSVVVFPHRFFMWNVVEAEEIRPHSLEIMNFVKPRPDYLIVGTGTEAQVLDAAFVEHFRRMGISVDACATFEACSTFNLCVEDNYNVACALLQPQFKAAKEPTPEQKNAEPEQASAFIGMRDEGPEPAVKRIE